MWQVRRADNFAIIVVPNVEVRMEAKHFILLLCLHDLLGKALPCFTYCFIVLMLFSSNWSFSCTVTLLLACRPAFFYCNHIRYDTE